MKENPLGRNAHLFRNLNRRTIGVWFREEVMTRLLMITLVIIAFGLNVLPVLL